MGMGMGMEMGILCRRRDLKEWKQKRNWKFETNITAVNYIMKTGLDGP